MVPDSTGPRVLGIEGTAWAASAAIYDAATDSVDIETEAYRPESGGIHPREAAEHMADHLPDVIESRLRRADGDVDCVAFSRGPGLGPCLRIAGTAARAVAQRLEVPLVGVNHMVAHLEVGRHRSGFASPVCLNASGANAHVLAFRNGRYRVLGETMDTGVGNAIDKFTRHVGWPHPGGPKVEEAALEGGYVDLPYVVKGMDFSFSGLMSAAKKAYDEGEAVEDVCFSLQENVFAMLAEVSERALSLTRSEELVLGGGVGQNRRLQEMLDSMCTQRGADFYVPEDRFLRDNAGMIAVLGAKMYAVGDTLDIEDSGIDADFRPDEVPVTWYGPEPVEGSAGPAGGDESRATEATVDRHTGTDDRIQGAEATVTFEGDSVCKERVPRGYRHPELDERLRTERTRSEARLTSDARRAGVPTPVLRDVDPAEGRLVFQRVGDCDLREAPTESRVRTVAWDLATMHEAGFVHGDPTTRNVRVDRSEGADPDLFFIDFGLGYYTDDPEDHAMDLHVFGQSLAGTADDADDLVRVAIEAYRDRGDRAVLERLREIEGRGRYQ